MALLNLTPNLEIPNNYWLIYIAPILLTSLFTWGLLQLKNRYDKDRRLREFEVNEIERSTRKPLAKHKLTLEEIELLLRNYEIYLSPDFSNKNKKDFERLKIKFKEMEKEIEEIDKIAYYKQKGILEGKIKPKKR